MKTSELLTLVGTTVVTGVAVGALTFDLVGDFRAEVRGDIRALRTDIHSLAKAQTRTESRLTHVEEQFASVRTDIHSLMEVQTRTESRVAHLEGQLVQLNLIARTDDAASPGEPELSPGE